MIFSRERGYVFVHIPKTGGTALTVALEARAAKDDIIVGDTPKAKARRRRLSQITTRGRLWKHSTLADMEGLVTPAELPGLFIFALVRNPWDRLVSYYHWLQGQTFDHVAVGLAKTLNFNGFLNHAQVQASLVAWPYGKYCCDSSGADRCRLWIRLEHFAEDVAPLEAHLGFRLAPLGVVNASGRSADYRRFYSDADAERLAMLCAEDIARFGYVF